MKRVRKKKSPREKDKTTNNEFPFQFPQSMKRPSKMMGGKVMLIHPNLLPPLHPI